MAELEYEGLVSLDQQKVKYIIEWTVGGDEDGQSEAVAYVVMKRAGGLLAALPVGFLPAEVLAEAQSSSVGLVGPSTTISVPGVLDEAVGESPIGADLEVLLVDLDMSVAQQFRVSQEVEDLAVTFSAEDPFATPSSQALLVAAREWAFAVVVQDQELSEGWYSAEGLPERRPASPKRQPRRRAPNGATDTESGTPRARRPTTASLQASLDSVLKTLPELTTAMTKLAERQSSLESQVLSVPPVSRSLAQPLSSQVSAVPKTLASIAHTLRPPPKTNIRTSLVSRESNAPEEVLELEAEKVVQEPDIARALMAQSSAITTLVAQLASSSSDPLTELQVAGGSGVRGSTGRAKLQSELAQQKGIFFDAVLRSMSRRMAPTMPADRPPQELLMSGVCGTKYLERFGGYGRQKELGVIMYNVMTIRDFMMVENWAAAKDSTALLAVMIEQAVLDSGRFEVAQILTLQEDIPSGVFTNRQLAQTSRARSFAPLSDQRWITTAIAFLKELDTITTKRTELLGGQKDAGSGPSQSYGSPKAKAKGKGKKKGQSSQNQEEEENQ